MENPFLFVLGCPRSGTSLLKRMLNAHPQIAMVQRLPWLAQRFERREQLTPEGMITADLLRGLQDKGKIGRARLVPAVQHYLEDLLASGRRVPYAEFMASIFDRFAKDQGKPYAGTKSLLLVTGIRTLHLLWPRAKFVHIIRDGRDVSLSAIHWRRAPSLAERYATWSEDAVVTSALWWEWHVRLAREAGSELGDKLYYEVKYEHLVTHPEEGCAALCAFLSVPYDRAMIRFHEGRLRDDPGLSAKHAWKPVLTGLRDWRSQMQPEDVERFEAVAGELLDELGFPHGAGSPSAKHLEHAVRLRRRFEGRPLPERW